jgi:hypothetical protein
MTYLTSLPIFLMRSSITNVGSEKISTVHDMLFNRNNHLFVSSEEYERIAQCISSSYTRKKAAIDDSSSYCHP